MTDAIAVSNVNTIILACEAGMGSSLMVVNSLKKKMKKAKVSGITIMHKPARAVPENANVIVVHEGLAKMARSKAPDAVILTFKHFLNDPIFDTIVNAFVNDGELKNMVA